MGEIRKLPVTVRDCGGINDGGSTAGGDQEGRLSQSRDAQVWEGSAGSAPETQLPAWPLPGASGAQQR